MEKLSFAVGVGADQHYVAFPRETQKRSHRMHERQAAARAYRYLLMAVDDPGLRKTGQLDFWEVADQMTECELAQAQEMLEKDGRSALG